MLLSGLPGSNGWGMQPMKRKLGVMPWDGQTMMKLRSSRIRGGIAPELRCRGLRPTLPHLPSRRNRRGCRAPQPSSISPTLPALSGP